MLHKFFGAEGFCHGSARLHETQILFLIFFNDHYQCNPEGWFVLLSFKLSKAGRKNIVVSCNFPGFFRVGW